jgi:hypothetical protein
MIRGSCCCKAIEFEISGVPSMMGTCHCSRCRKVGASTFVFVKRNEFRWVKGQEYVARYTPAPPFNLTRCFCQRCGTALGEPESPDDSFPIAANCLDDDPLVRNRFHEFVSSKPCWYEIQDGAKQFPEHPAQST